MGRMHVRRKLKALDLYDLLRRTVLCVALLSGVAFWLYALLEMMAGSQ